jgi:succinate dehydrogenase/fumarate reductase flavoprotein subunit
VRPETVEAITRSHFVKVSAAEQAMIDRASKAEHQAAAVAIYHAREARRLLEEMGILRVPSVLDVTRADVYHIGRRADALQRAMLELDVSGAWQEHITLGQVLKVARREQARAAVRILREGGHQVDDLTVSE